MMQVLVLPPSESRSNRVSLLSLKSIQVGNYYNMEPKEKRRIIRACQNTSTKQLTYMGCAQDVPLEH